MLVGLIQIQKSLLEPRNANLTVKNDVFRKKVGGERVKYPPLKKASIEGCC